MPNPSPISRNKTHLALSAAVLALSAGCGSDDSAPAPSLPPPSIASFAVSDGARLDPRLAGTWRDLGKQAYIQFGENSMRIYHETSSYCIADAEPVRAQDVTGFSASGDTTASGGRVDVIAVPGVPPELRLQRVASLPAACSAAPPTDAQASARALCETIDLLYPFLRERNIGWSARCAQLQQAAARARDKAELGEALAQALDGFNDAHVSLHDGASGEEIFRSWTPAPIKMLQTVFAAQEESDDFEAFQAAWVERQSAAVSAHLTERHVALDGAVVWGKLPGNVGYLSIERMGGYGREAGMLADIRLAGEEIDRIVAALQDTRAMIVDVAFNQGGYDPVSAAFAARFADSRRLAFTSHTRETGPALASRWEIAPAGPRQYLKPVYLLTSDHTISAGETFTLMMRVFPHVRQAGQRTAGAMSDMLARPLPGGFTVTLPHQINLDPSGALFEVAGIPPHLPIVLFDPAKPATLEGGHAAALDALVATIVK